MSCSRKRQASFSFWHPGEALGPKPGGERAWLNVMPLVQVQEQSGTSEGLAHVTDGMAPVFFVNVSLTGRL